jgi:hypothetical protein
MGGPNDDHLFGGAGNDLVDGARGPGDIIVGDSFEIDETFACNFGGLFNI